MARPAHSKHSVARDIIELVLLVVAAFGIALAIRTYVAEPFVIPSTSMTETLKVGDRVIGEKLTYLNSDPQVGDIVTFEDPEDSSQILIKRVIATAGETVELKGGSVYVNGVKLDEDEYTLGKQSNKLYSHATSLDANIEYPYTVPEGCVWVMGDNRTNSLDSRYFGAIKISSITSRALFVFWPIEDIGSLE